MGDFKADKNQLTEEKRSIFDSFKFWGHRPKHRDSLRVDIEKSPENAKTDESTNHTPIEKWIESDQQNTQENESTKHTPEEKWDETNPSSVRLYETISGNYIITRGWDGNNMLVYKTRRKN